MLKSRFVLFAVLAALCAPSCSDPDKPDEPGEPAVEAEFTAVAGLSDRSVQAEGESFTISITATAAREVSTAAWITATPSRGEAGSFDIEVEVGAAAAGEERSGFIRLTCGKDTRSMLVSQISSREPGPEDLKNYPLFPFADIIKKYGLAPSQFKFAGASEAWRQK